MSTTNLFTWNKSNYTDFPIYTSGDTPVNTVSNLTNQAVELNSSLNLPTNLFITNTTTGGTPNSNVQETYLFTTTSGNLTLGTVVFTVAYNQISDNGSTTTLPSLASVLKANGIFSEFDGYEAIMSFNNTTGIRTLDVTSVKFFS